MIKHIVNKLLVILVLTASMLVAVPLVAVSAETPKDAVCQGAGAVDGSGGCSNPAGSPDVDGVVAVGLNLFTAIVGIIAVVMIIISGIKYMTSQGDSGKVNEAKNTILYAVIGLVIVALAQFIVRYVINQFTSS